ncbi:MAG: hypothetical protein CMP47_15925 [Rickettsiales bacterium]|nr:hypothetical protein [Rickettsiales bacterium]
MAPSYNIASELWKQCTTFKGQLRDSPHAAARFRRPKSLIAMDKAMGHSGAKSLIAMNKALGHSGSSGRSWRSRKNKTLHDNTRAGHVKVDGEELTSISRARQHLAGRNTEAKTNLFSFPQHRTSDDATPSKIGSLFSPPRKNVVGYYGEDLERTIYTEARRS